MEFCNSKYKGPRWKRNEMKWNHGRSRLKYSFNYENKKENKVVVVDNTYMSTNTSTNIVEKCSAEMKNL